MYVQCKCDRECEYIVYVPACLKREVYTRAILYTHIHVYMYKY